MSTMTQNLNTIKQHIAQAEQKSMREAGSVKLLAVTKTQPVSAIKEAIQAGQLYFAENYLQEALPKIDALKNEELEWHFIGPVQSNKTKGIAEYFHWVHSIDRIKTAERLNNQRPIYLPKLQVCLEVNVDEDPAKSGVKLQDLSQLARDINQFPRLQLRGLMTILSQYTDKQRIVESYTRLRTAYQILQEQGLSLDTLSMGMSADYEIAIACGSTCVRIGTAIFGERN